MLVKKINLNNLLFSGQKAFHLGNHRALHDTKAFYILMFLSHLKLVKKIMFVINNLTQNN